MAINLSYLDLKKEFEKVKNLWPEGFDKFEKHRIEYLRETRPDRIYYVDRKAKDVTYDPVDHHPELKEYEVWMEGYVATGEHGKAQLIGKITARNFAQACHMLMAKAYLDTAIQVNAPDFKKKLEYPGRWDYSPSDLSLWGSRLYWNEELARKTYG